MKVYLAAQFARQQELCGYRQDLLNIGWHVVSSWLDEESENVDPVVIAENDLWDLNSCDSVILFTGPPYHGTLTEVARGGRHFEFGWAYGQKKLCILIGEPESPYHYFPDIQRFKTWTGFMKYVTI